MVMSVVISDWQSPETKEALWMLSQQQRIAVKSHLFHVGSDVMGVIRFAKSLI